MGRKKLQHTKGKADFNKLMTEFAAENNVAKKNKNIGHEIKASLDAFEDGNF